ncbi:4-oxalomesaconate tautomerase, partial [Streptomyces sp. NPDC001793]
LGLVLVLPGTVARVIVPHAPQCGDYTLEHPGGVICIGIASEGGRPARAGVVRTARKIFDGIASPS